MQAFFSSLLNLIIPGAGPALLGRWRLAFLTQGTLIILILALCWSRLIFEAWAIKTLLGVIGSIYLISTALCFTGKRPASINPLRQCLLTVVFIMVGSSGLAAGYVYKHHWLGIHIYFVPSMSMHPTLKPGQFILLDTWAYQQQKPQLNDVVVFEHGVEKRNLVKRINHWPKGELTKKELWYVMGDNRDFSHDSRYFGGITTEQLIGEVKLVLIAINNKKSLQIGFLLSPVH